MSKKEMLITILLKELGLSSSYKGYSYLFYGLLLLLEEEELLTRITKGLYKEIAAHYQVKPANVERNIRTAVFVIWEKNKEAFCKNGYYYCPSNGDFFDLLLYEIEKRYYLKIS